MTRWLRALGLAGAVLLCQGFQCGPGGPPAPDTCGAGAAPRGVLQLELGYGEGGDFRPMPDDAQVTLVHGPQGGSMVPLRLRASGDDPPVCLEQSTRLAYRCLPTVCPPDDLGSSQTEAQLNAPLATYSDADRVRSTRPAYLILGGPIDTSAPATLTVEAYGQTVTRRLHVSN